VLRSLANALRLPWSDELHGHSISHGYVGVATHVDGLIHLAHTGTLPTYLIVLPSGAAALVGRQCGWGEVG
jgi:3-oxoacyl-[acyl-carrier-protein] synthase III